MKITTESSKDTYHHWRWLIEAIVVCNIEVTGWVERIIYAAMTRVSVIPLPICEARLEISEFYTALTMLRARVTCLHHALDRRIPGKCNLLIPDIDEVSRSSLVLQSQNWRSGFTHMENGKPWLHHPFCWESLQLARWKSHRMNTNQSKQEWNRRLNTLLPLMCVRLAWWRYLPSHKRRKGWSLKWWSW